jgi:serine/threonine protein kinase/tetratricopeptide (TPR) repeat protein
MLNPGSDLGSSRHHQPDRLEDLTVAAPAPLGPTREVDEHPALRPGMVLGRYLLLEQVGSGGMGVVMAAYDRELDRRVALKLLRPDLSRSGEARMRREAQSLAQLQHPSVVTVYEVGTIEGQLFIAMEYVDGLTFDAWATRHRGQWRKLVEVAIRAGRGVAAAHAVGLVHRDIKPSNILVGQDGRVCVADFGIATITGRTVDADVLDIEVPGRRTPRSNDAEASVAGLTRTLTAPEPTSPVGLMPTPAASESASPITLTRTSTSTEASERPSGASWSAWLDRIDALTEAGAVVGTPAYMAPEQHRGEPVDARSDQFAFCVALYRVLYDDPPFAGDDLESLRIAVAVGRVKPAPAGTTVPASVRRVLLRGLAIQPERRWPTMTALLDALARTLSRRRRWVALVGVVVGVIGAGLAGLVPEADGMACPSAEERLRGVWDEDQRVAVREAFVASDLPYATDTWTRTQERLDRHAASWSERYQALCIEMGDAGASAALDLEMACLRGRREELRALVELLAQGDSKVVAKATQAAAELTPVTSCRSEGVEAAAMASPRPDQQAAVDEIRLTLARAEAAFKAGTLDVGIEHAAAALASARTLGYAPVEVEALYRLGTLQALSGQLDEAVRSLGDAALRGVEVRHDRIAARAATMIAFVVGYQQGRPDEGLVWIRHAAAALERLEPDPVLDADLRVTRAAVLSAQGHFEEALPEFRAGLEQRLQALGEDHPLVASSYNNLGSTLVELGRYDEALQALGQAEAIWQRSYGPRHPVVATAINGIGVVLEQMGRYEEARQRFEEALVVREAVFGSDHVNVAVTLDNLGSVLAHLGEHEEARAASQRALDLRATHLGVRHPHYASSLVNLGLVAEKQGRLDEAADYHHRAIEIWEEALGPEHPYLGHPLTSLGRTELLRGRPKLAQELLTRAQRIREAANKPGELAETRLALAQSLWLDDPARARSLAQRAATDIQAAVHGPDALRVEIERWLVEHPAPTTPPSP